MQDKKLAHIDSAMKSYIKYEGFKHNLGRIEEFNFPDFGYYFISYFETTADAIVALYGATSTEEKMVAEKYFDNLSESKYWTRITINEILQEYDSNKNTTATEKSIELMRNDKRFYSYFTDKSEESIAMSWHSSLSNRALWLMAEKAKYSKTELIETKSSDRKILLSWVSTLIKNCDESDESCDFTLSKIFLHMRNGRSESIACNKDNILETLSESRSNKLRSGYVYMLEWMTNNGMHDLYKRHLPSFVHRHKSNINSARSDDLEKYISNLIDKGVVKEKYLEDRLVIGDTSTDSIVNAYENGYRFRSKATTSKIEQLISEENHSVIYAYYAQQCCELYDHIDFRTIYSKAFSENLDLNIAAKSLLNCLSISERNKLEMWEKSIEESCKKITEKEKASFSNLFLLGFPGVEAYRLISKYSSGEQYTFNDMKASGATIAVWLATLALTQDGRDAWKYLKNHAKSKMTLFFQKTIDLACSISQGTRNSIDRCMLKFWASLGLDSELDINGKNTNKYQNNDGKFPQAKRVLFSLDSNADNAFR